MEKKVNGVEQNGKRMAALAAAVLAAVVLGALLFTPPLFQPGYDPLNPQPVTVQGLLRVELNTADEAALRSLPGLGEKKARAILQYRADHGPFSSLEELAQISAVTSKDLEAWDGYLYIE
ncbi:ComEA family DNA-binding protein [Allofournierella sp.]|uniref:ComEA family DNA-binding protein n=1 Tax=Allofournierella sp. TaxID=1940256 RepID=UPI003AF0D3DC